MTRPRAVPVPRLYKVAASVYQDFNAGKDSVKNLVYQARDKHPNLKAIFALVMEALNHTKAIEAATNKIELFTKEPRFQKELAFVLITELLFGKKVLPGRSIPVLTLQKYKNQLENNLKGLENLSGREKNRFPKYARVNSLCNSLHRVARDLREDGWLEVMYDKKKTTYARYLDMVAELDESNYLVDYHLENVLVFPPKSQLYDHNLVKDGSLLLQDKASCLPVHALSPPPGSVVLDACSAPGMKTSQIASLVCGDWVAAMGGSPPPGAKVVAVERSTKRCGLLKQILQKSRADCVCKVINADFLEIQPQDYSDVEYIVLDPSCSGTGMINRNSLEDQAPTLESLQTFANSQIRLLTHALSFPSVKRLVYSTCAVSREENEGVIEHVLKEREDWRTCIVLPRICFIMLMNSNLDKLGAARRRGDRK
ncbi:probable 28S rRNA (cytosine-C(5))-methyltransferase isoform X2 [Eurytemora carolleeae]|uniref:probable 28S rRNA (cytosine-C(5))-methyltransferase isoform X2 n=1 Tax=Eurytemora carolleeae TaxID=1294199 RepID=UPI000C77072A|nr:probable 28S rRNA (cytosine-C(5))-methyltransferase isoform X2 [Eurytemora carolleeae]|eukprot:XP_023322278.1 probable 28S rRNA (cytosine-C(5))-methyltransferase isoform X2 [Eurytemora affinis]